MLSQRQASHNPLHNARPSPLVLSIPVVRSARLGPEDLRGSLVFLQTERLRLINYNTISIIIIFKRQPTLIGLRIFRHESKSSGQALKRSKHFRSSAPDEHFRICIEGGLTCGLHKKKKNSLSSEDPLFCCSR